MSGTRDKYILFQGRDQVAVLLKPLQLYQKVSLLVNESQDLFKWDKGHDYIPG